MGSHQTGKRKSSTRRRPVRRADAAGALGSGRGAWKPRVRAAGAAVQGAEASFGGFDGAARGQRRVPVVCFGDVGARRAGDAHGAGADGLAESFVFVRVHDFTLGFVGFVGLEQADRTVDLLAGGQGTGGRAHGLAGGDV